MNMRMVLHATAFLILIAGVAHGQTASPSAPNILKKMITQYAAASSYQDFGEVRVVPDAPIIANGLGAGIQQVSFQNDLLVAFNISYSRPQSLRFDWRNSLHPGSRKAAVWSDGTTAYSWTPTVYPTEVGSFTLYTGGSLWGYLDEATRSAARANFIVPSLLVKDLTFSSFDKMLIGADGLSVLSEEAFGGEICYVIKAKMSGTPWMLWVGKESSLLRKTRTWYSKSSSFHTGPRPSEPWVLEETHNDIKINEEIPKSVFEYRPQLLKGDVDMTRYANRAPSKPAHKQ